MEGCIVCGNQREPNRKYCRRCYLNKRKEFHKRDLEKGKVKKRFGRMFCTDCGKEIIKYRETQERCLICSAKNLHVQEHTPRLKCKFIGMNYGANYMVMDEHNNIVGYTNTVGKVEFDVDLNNIAFKEKIRIIGIEEE